LAELRQTASIEAVDSDSDGGNSSILFAPLIASEGHRYLSVAHAIWQVTSGAVTVGGRLESALADPVFFQSFTALKAGVAPRVTDLMSSSVKQPGGGRRFRSKPHLHRKCPNGIPIAQLISPRFPAWARH